MRLASASAFETAAVTLDTLAALTATLFQSGETRLRFDNGMQLIVPAGVLPGTPIALVLPLDGLFDDRAWAAKRLYALTQGQLIPSSLTAQQRDRLAQMLRAVDGRQDGASHRRIAEALFGDRRVPRGDAWKGSELRSRTLRLVAEGLALVRGGYHRLLRWRDRQR